MVRKFIYVLAALLALSSPAFAGAPQCEDCNLVKRGVHRQVIPTDDVVCFWFVQPRVQDVLLKLYQRDGTARPYSRKNAKMHDRICVGRQWVRNMTRDSFICDEKTARFDYAQPGMVETLAEKPKYSREGEACLYGKDKCREMGYPSYR